MTVSGSPRFGTDGLRGVANVDLTPELLVRLGRAAGRHLGDGPVFVGRDTRRSGPMLEAALAAGLASVGRDVELVGVVATPTVAWAAVREGRAAAMLSASHNPFGDNGIKLFAPGGRKLDDVTQAQLERDLADPPNDGMVIGAAVGTITSRPDVVDAYVDWLVGLRPDAGSGLTVVLDAANGSGTTAGRRVLEAVGAEVLTIGDAPDGRNINDGVGSTHPQALAAAVVEAGADLGLALDGDADRLVAVDGSGGVVDGDHLLALFAADLRDRGELADQTVVVTVMTNLGFHLAMERDGIDVVQTPVGDRHVLMALEEGGFSLGGEQSGHLIFSDLLATGDGLLSGVLLCDLVRRSGRPLADLAEAAMTRLPQVLVNVPLRPGDDPLGRLAASVAAATDALGGQGRVLVRPSGTEPLVRIMVEAPTEAEAASVAEDLAAVARGDELS